MHEVVPLHARVGNSQLLHIDPHDVYAVHWNISVWLIINITKFLIFRTKTAAIAGFGIISHFTVSLFCWTNKISKRTQNLALWHTLNLTASFINSISSIHLTLYSYVGFSSIFVYFTFIYTRHLQSCSCYFQYTWRASCVYTIHLILTLQE